MRYAAMVYQGAIPDTHCCSTFPSIYLVTCLQRCSGKGSASHPQMRHLQSTHLTYSRSAIQDDLLIQGQAACAFDASKRARSTLVAFGFLVHARGCWSRFGDHGFRIKLWGSWVEDHTLRIMGWRSRFGACTWVCGSRSECKKRQKHIIVSLKPQDSRLLMCMQPADPVAGMFRLIVVHLNCYHHKITVCSCWKKFFLLALEVHVSVQ